MVQPRKARHCQTCQCAPELASTVVLAVDTPTPLTEGDHNPMHTCSLLGHDYSSPGRAEDGTYGWRLCACGGALPGHDAGADPAGGDGCGMAYRLCRYCDHIDEAALIDGLPSGYGHLPVPSADRPAPARGEGVQPGGSLRQDVATGLGLPTDTTHSSGHMTTGETAMVEAARPATHRPEAGAA